MKSTLELLTGRILKAFEIDILMADNLESYLETQTKEIEDLDSRLLTIDSIFAGLVSARDQISRKLDDVLQVKKDLIRQRDVMEVAAEKSKEDLLISQEHIDFGADTATLAKAHKVLFTQDDQLLAEIIQEIDNEYLVKGLRRLDKSDLAHLKLVIADIEAEK